MQLTIVSVNMAENREEALAEKGEKEVDLEVTREINEEVDLEVVTGGEVGPGVVIDEETGPGTEKDHVAGKIEDMVIGTGLEVAAGREP